jgi:hypothetical protein
MVARGLTGEQAADALMNMFGQAVGLGAEGPDRGRKLRRELRRRFNRLDDLVARIEAAGWRVPNGLIVELSDDDLERKRRERQRRARHEIQRQLRKRLRQLYKRPADGRRLVANIAALRDLALADEKARRIAGADGTGEPAPEVEAEIVIALITFENELRGLS